MIEIIPAIDLIDGKCVRLSQGDFSKKTIYNEDPVDVAKQFEKAGVKRLHLVDLDGARHGKIKNLKVLKAIADKTKLKIDFGGGIKTDHDIESVFDAGAAMATIGSIAVKHPEILETWMKKFGAKKIFIGADVKNERLVIGGWLKQTNIGMYEFIDRYVKRGVDTLFCTDVAKDGMLKGSSVHLYSRILLKFPGLNLIASGGVSSVDDINTLQRIGCKGVIIGKALYEGNITLKDLKPFLK
jgi:phosphoribosylformimino-5-aminoimidazole carboxamide ribotide isomerase